MTKLNTIKDEQNCPCGTGNSYLNCCGLFISNQRVPATPEELMRSRYTAYHQVNIDYIIQTMKSPAADDFDLEAARAWAEKLKWIKLEIIDKKYHSLTGFVEFIAYYFLEHRENILHEISEFHFENGRWYYVNGIYPNEKLSIENAKKIGRNDKCQCGSNKKYKKCCG